MGTPLAANRVVREGLDILGDMNSSKGDPRELTRTQLRTLRQMFEDRDFGLYMFAQFIFGYRDLNLGVHLPMCQLLGRWGETHLDDGTTIYTPPDQYQERHIAESYRRLMITVPREMFKTSIATRANALWQLSRNPDITIGIFNENEKKAEQWVGAIAEVVEASALFQMLWPEILPPGIAMWERESGKTLPRKWKWGSTGLRFNRPTIGISELSLQGFGIGAAATGLHFTHKILDDIIGEKSAQSAAVMQDAIHWVDNARPLERPAENGCELVVHTPWAYGDVYAHMLKRWPGEYKVYKRHILEDPDGNPDPINGKSIFPEKISTAKAKHLLKIDPYINSSQYMCLPRAGRDLSFDDKWVRLGKITFHSEEPVFRIHDEFYDPTIYDTEVSRDERPPQFIPLSWCSIAIIIDPMPGKPAELKSEPGSSHGVAITAKDPWGRRILLEARRSKSTPVDLYHEVMALRNKWHASVIAVEEVNFSYVYQPLFIQLAATYGQNFDLMPVSPKGRHKDERIKQSLQPAHEAGFWYYNEVNTTLAIQELTEFPHSEAKDIIDAMSYTDVVLQRPETPREWSVSYYNQRRRDSGRGVTGYGEWV